MDRRKVLFFVLAAGLLVPIVMSAMRFADLKRTDEAMDAVEERLERDALAPALGALRKVGDQASLSSKQETRRSDLAMRIVEKAVSTHHPVHKIGMVTFDAHAEGVLAFGAGSVTIHARLRPRELVGTVVAMRFSETHVPFRKGALTHQVNLPPSGDPLVLTLGAILTLPGGREAEVPLAGALRLRQDRSRPKVSVRIGDQLLRAEGATLAATVPPGAALTVGVTDSLTLRQASATFDGNSDIRRHDGDVSEDTFTFAPAQFTKSGKRQLVIEAENVLGNATRVTVDLDVKGRDWLPMKEAWLGSKRLVDGDNLVKETKADLRIVLEDDVTPEAAGLSVNCDGMNPAPEFREVDGALVATIDLQPGRKTGVSLVRGARRLKTWLIRTDSAAPKVVVTAGPDQVPLNPDEMNRLEAGTTVTVTARDDNGVEKLSIVHDGLTPAGAERRGGKQISRNYKIGNEADGGLTIVAVDALGNATEAAKWRIRARRRIRITSLKVGETDAGLDVISVNSNAVELRFEYEGEGRLTWSLHDADGVKLASGDQQLDPDSAGTATIDLAVKDALDVAREIRLADALASKSLGNIKLRVDRIPPRLRIGDWDPEKDGPRARFNAAPGSRLVIEVEDASGTATVQVTGSVVLEQVTEGTVTRVTVGVPESLPANLVVRAQDAAGNVNGLAFQVVTPSAVPAVSLNLFHGGQTVQHDGPLRVKRPSELRAVVVNGTMVRATLGGTVLPIARDGSIGDPTSVPGQGPLELVIRDNAGTERTLRFLVQLVPYSVPADLRARLARATRFLMDGDAPKARAEAAAVEKDVHNQSQKHLDRGEVRLFLDQIRTLREQMGGESVGGAPRSSPTFLENTRDRARLLRVAPEETGAKFVPMYLYRSEVTVAMYRRFLTAVGDDAAWWAALPDPLDIRRPMRGSERARALAKRLVTHASAADHPVHGFTPAVAEAYVRWAGKGLRDGKLRVPTPTQWRLAAGRGLHPGATFPTTGGHPDGANLKSANVLGAGDGAAFGYSGRKEPLASGSFDPGAYGLHDMAGNLWEIVRNQDNQWFVLGGGYASRKQDCRLDNLKALETDNQRLTGLRPVWIPKQ